MNAQLPAAPPGQMWDESWRAPALDAILRASAVVGVIWMVAVFIATPVLLTSVYGMVAIGFVLLVGLASLRRQLPMAVRFGIIMSAYLGISALNLMIIGSTPGAPILMTLFVLLAAFYYGWRGGVVAGGITIALICGAAVGWTRGWFPLLPQISRLEPTRLDFWVRSAFGQTLAAIVITAVVVYVLRDIRTALAELRSSEEKFQAAFRNCPDALIISESDTGRFLDVNDSFQRITGYTREETIGRTSVDLVVFKDDQTRSRALESLLAGGSSRELEISIRRRDGSQVVVLASAGLCNIRGQRCLVTMIHDITERNRIGEALRQSEERFRTLIENAPVAVSISRSGRAIYANALCLRMIGVGTLEDINGRPVSEYFAPEYRQASEERSRRRSQGIAVPGEFETVLLRRDGSRFPAQISVVSVRLHDGPANAAFVTDISERRQAEQKIREQAALLDTANDAIYVRGLDRTILYWNRGAERLYGWSEKDALNQKTTDLFTSDITSAQATQELLLQQGSWSGERHQVNKAGNPVMVFSRLTLVRDASGRPQSVLAINTDVTEKKQFETQFLRAQRMESLGALASGIAHDLNNVLAPIIMGTQVLREVGRTESDRKILATIETSARRGAEIVKQVLTFARGIEGERVPLQPKHFLKDMEMIAAETFPKNIRIESAIEPDLWPILGDATQVHQTMMNLCLNARDAMPAGGTLTLGAANVIVDEQLAGGTNETHAWVEPAPKPGPYVCLRVIDTGTGVAPENFEKIFEPFFTTKAQGKGTGLGLSTVLGIVRSHGGFLRLRSELNKGTRFEIYFPATPTAQVAAGPKVDIEKLRGRGQLVLVVDDEPAIRMVAQSMLEEYGYKVIAAEGGAEAIKIFAERHGSIAAVITDMAMPDMDGPALVKILRQLDPGVRVIGMSGLGEKFGGKSNIPWGLPVLLMKPFTGDKLLLTLSELFQPTGTG